MTLLASWIFGYVVIYWRNIQKPFNLRVEPMKISGILVTVGILLLILILVSVSLALTLGIAIGIGWLLTLFLPFSLFEASLLGIIASVIVGTFWYNLLESIPGLKSTKYDDDFDDEEDEDYDSIPASRFFKTNSDKTWEGWLRYQLANDIYTEFQEEEHSIISKGEKQAQELAIRLADIVIPMLKTKSPKAKRLSVTLPALKQQMNKMGQRPYDDDILNPAVMAVNWNLDYNYENVMQVIRAKSWNAPCELFDLF